MKKPNWFTPFSAPKPDLKAWEKLAKATEKKPKGKRNG